MSEYKGIEYLRAKLAVKRPRVLARYEYYDMKQHVPDFNISTPPHLRGMMSTLGWCGKAVDSIADRLIFAEFADDNFGMNEVFRMNNPDILASSAILSALKSSCSFIYIYPDNSGFPKLEVIDGANATGNLDESTGLLKEGYAVLERDDNKNPVREAYFIPGITDYYEDGKAVRRYRHAAEYPLLVPIINRPDAQRPFGRSRISRACMSLMGSAIRTVKRSEITAEFYSFPQKWVTGLEQGAEMMEKWKASMSSILQFTKDDDGDRPTVGQFTQAAMTPHLEQLRMFASMFGGETGLTLDDLGFPSQNPSSADAIKASHETLRLTSRKAQRDFGTGLLNTGYLAACIRDEYPYKRRQIYLTTPKWRPIFEPDMAQLSGIGDAVLKIQQAFPDYFTPEKLEALTGI